MELSTIFVVVGIALGLGLLVGLQRDHALDGAVDALGGHRPGDGWRLILVGTLSNTVFKTATIGVLGSRELLIRMAIIHSVGVVTGVLLLLFWPG